MMQEAVISVRELCRDFGRRRALDGVSFSVDKGEVFGYLGPNGAGKSTTVKILLGLLAPSSGSVRVLGLDPRARGAQVRRQTGVVFDSCGHYMRLSVESNLRFFASLYRASPERVDDLLKKVGLAERKSEPVEHLSRGMRQRLALARALVHEPSVLFLDEPTAGLDPLAARGVRRLILDFQSAGGTVLLTTHYLDEAEELCGRVAILDRGRVLAMGTTDELRDRYLQGSGSLEEVFLAVAGRSLTDAVEGG